MKDATIKAIAVVVLGIIIVAFGCTTQLVGHADLHGFLVAAGALMIWFGVWELI